MEKSCSKNQWILQLCIVILTLSFKPAFVLALGNETDRLALLALKDELVGGSPRAGPLNSWNDSLRFCDWEGVRCGYRHQRVRALNLVGLKLAGLISPLIANLTFLREVDFSDNILKGNIPMEFGHLRRLRYLNLSHNNLQGQLPVVLTNCSSIQVLYLSYNNLTGKIPFNIGVMKNLIQFSVGFNSLSGTIPSSIGNLSSLNRLVLEQNHFQGYIPRTLGRLSKLDYLALFVNKLSGTLPLAVYNLSSMVMLGFAGNRLYGGLEPELGFAFPKLEEFYIGLNQFSGTIPRSVSNMSRLQIFDIGANNFVGSVPNDLGNLKNLQALLIDYNYLGSGKAGDLDFISSLTNCTQLQMLCLQLNRFGGALPSSVANLSTQLQILYMAENQIYAGNISSDQSNPSMLKGTIGYVAPEYGMGGTVSPEGDIYGYGILLLEMITGRRPTDDLFQDGLSLHNFCKMTPPGQLIEILDSRLLEEIGEMRQRLRHRPNMEGEIWECLVSFTKIGVACSVEAPGDRMTMKDAIVELKAAKARGKSGKGLISIALFEDGYLRLSYKELLEATQGFASSNLIGSESFGSVYKGVLHQQENPVIVKVLNLQNHSSASRAVNEPNMNEQGFLKRSRTVREH
ncbi:hypothetical protein PTKIN_Ptkin16aG0534900 [Pterospermum kingtungense]